MCIRGVSQWWAQVMVARKVHMRQAALLCRNSAAPPLLPIHCSGLEALQQKWPQEVLPLGAVVGGLTAAAAAHLGLPEGLPVAQGGADADIGMVGRVVAESG